MQWEFTSDYSIVNDQGGGVLVPHKRFWFVKHFCNLTPQGADALATTSSKDRVLFTAFAGKENGRDALVMHVLNESAEREARITGLPDGYEGFRVVRTSEAEDFAEIGRLENDPAGVTITLTARSLTTLTTDGYSTSGTGADGSNWVGLR